MARGDHLKVKRPLRYWHHGIDLGGGRVIHYDGEVGNKKGAAVRIASFQRFADGGEVEIVSYGRCDAPEEVIHRAMSCLGEKKYSLLFRNCEHFATWCKTGIERSEQVRDRVAVALGGTATVGGSVGALGLVAAAGAVEGLSGAGVMSGLAAAGGVVGGGAVAGVGVLAAAPAALGVGAVNVLLGDNEDLPSDERAARKAGRTAGTVGAFAGTVGAAGAVTALAAEGAVGAAAITSGLSALGATVGGGMVLGTGMLVAAPAVAAVGIAYGVYKLFGGGDSISTVSPPQPIRPAQPAALGASYVNCRFDAAGDYLCPRCGGSAGVAWCGRCEVGL